MPSETINESAYLEVTVLGKPFTAISDKSGNYQIKIDGNTLKSVSTFQIEAKKAGCERFKVSESVPKSEIINKDIVLQLSTIHKSQWVHGSSDILFLLFHKK